MMISYFNQEKHNRLKEKVFELLELRGVRIDHPGMIERLDRAGARVNQDGGIVRFPKDFLEEQIAKAPREFALYARGEREALQLPTVRSWFHTRTNTGAHSWIEPESGLYRRITLTDVANWGRLADALEHIDFCGFPGPSDVPSETVDLHSFKTLLQHSHKHIWVQPYTLESVDDLITLSEVAASNEGALRTNPPVSFIVCAFSPLAFKALDMDILTKSANKGIPLQLCSAPVAGGTAPITSPGVALMAIVEIMAMVTMSQVVRPGTPVIATPLIFAMDMHSGRSLQSTPEAIRGCALAGQFIKGEFGLPTHSYGTGTDSPVTDGQCMNEGAITCLTMALSGIDILGGAGQLETATTISPLQLIIDDELFGKVRKLMSEMRIDDESLDWEYIMEIDPSDNFLRSPHTRRHAGDAWTSDLFTRLGRESWEREGNEGLLERAKGIYQQIIKQKPASVLSEDQIKEMESILADADLRAGSM